MSQFTPAGSGGLTPSINILGASTPTIVQIPLASAGTEYSYVLPSGCRQFLIKLQGDGRLRLAYVALGTSGTSYLEVPRYCFFSESDIQLNTSLTLYMQSSVAAQTAELLYWT